MNFFAYVLLSMTRSRTYSGQTDEVQARLARHNAGKVKSTKAYRPWVLIHSEGFVTRAEAMQREKWFKSAKGRKFIAELVEEWKTGGGLSVWSRQGGRNRRDLDPTVSDRTKPL